MLLFLWILLVPGGLALTLSFSSQPSSSIAAYSTFSVTVTKSQSDTASVFLSLDPSTASDSVVLYGTLTTTFSSSSSTATFSNLYLTTTGSGLKLIAAAIGYSSISSSSFAITSATSQTLYFSSQPSSSSNPCTSNVVVKVLTSPIGKNVVDTSFSSSITLSLIPGNGSGTMTSVSVTASSGVSTFSSCAVTGAGTFVLKASSSGLTDAYSSSFTIASGTPSSITFNSYPTTIYKGSGFSVTATVTDSNGYNVVSSITCYLQAQSGNGQISSGGSATLNIGSLSFTNVIYTGTGSVTIGAYCSGYSAFSTTFAATSYTNGEVAINLNDAIFEGTYNQYYQIYLTDAPTADVVVSLASKDSSSIELTTTSLTFTTSNYATAQKVYFNTGMLASSTYPVNIGVIHSISSNDATYNGVANFQTCLTATSGSVSVPIYGSTKYYIQADYSVGLQAKDSATLYISIGSQPSQDVIVSLSLSNSYITLSASQVTFTSSSWSTQRILITGPTSASSPYETTTITYSVSTSDTNFNNAIFYPSDKTTTAVILPASSPTIKVSSSAILVQNKQYTTFDVWLSSQPSATVTVSMTSSDTTNLSVTTSSLSFTTSDYKLFKQATIYAAAGSMGTNPYTSVTVTLAGSGGGFGSATTTIPVSVANICINAPYAWPNGSKCTCQAGFNCMGSTPVPCPPGTYSAVDDMVCTACQPGEYCPNPASSVQTCASGTYSYEYYSFCLGCPGGFSCTDQNGYKIQRCVQGQYASPGSGTCTSPASGYMAPGPEFAYTVACPSGYIIVGAPDMCVPCPAGVSCSGDPVTYTACTAGTYSLAGMASCATCPDNMECDPFQGPTRICPEGTYRASGESMCKLCPAGSYCSASEGNGSSSRPKTCPSNTDSVAGQAYCISTTTLASYPGLKSSGSGVTTSTDVADYVGIYDAWKDNIICSSGWGWCYPIPGGESGSGTYATSNKYSYIGSKTISDAFMGFWLPDNADRPDMIGFECWPGYWCKDGSKTACTAGQFNPVVRAYSASFCFNCPLGYLCDVATGNYENYPCPQGKYCTDTATSATDCPAGTYYKKLRAISEGYCLQCPEGYYCGAGTANPTICPTGSICPIGSSAATNCPEGSYNPLTGKYKVEDCLLCPAGTYCTTGSTQPVPCPPGKIGPYQGNPLTSCWVCPAGFACPGAGTIEATIKCEIGYYCPEGSNRKTQNPCPPGTLGTLYGAYGLAQCDQCPPGFACGYATNYVNNPPQVCAAGYYCPIGTHYTTEFPCPAGTYSTRTRVEGVHECLICPAGYYCPSGSSSYSSNTCPTGYYCPRGTTYDKQYICPVGTYSAAGASDQGECTFCPVGKFCPGYDSSSVPPISCPAGTYMDELGAQDGGPGVYPSCKRCPAGKYSTSAGSTTCTDAGVGYYTYEGAAAQYSCKAGFFCPKTATSELMMYLSVCPAGYVCPASMNHYPELSNDGCPVGQYCPEGSSSGTDCPVGTYRKTIGAKSVNDCKTVPAGYYVSTTGVSDYSSYVCSAGYYCPKGSTSSTAMACPAGTFRSTTGGASVSDCASCTPGYYCSSTATVTPTICTIGSYCPSGTITPLQCPSGTYGTATGLATSTDCTSCDAGSYCQSPGQIAVTDDCTAGFYCSGGASIATPNDGQTGKICPAGGYCPAGTTSPQKCTAGTFNNFSGGRSSTDCVTCWPGYYCAGTDLSPSPTGKCDPGYYCPAGESTSNSHAAQAGYYAPSGSVAEIACPAGTYNPSTAASACISCDPGNYCPTTTLTSVTSCEAGKYCLQGSFIGKFCPAGTYRAATGGQSIDDCTLCDANKYCLYSGKTAVENSCSAGYYCISSSPYPQPYTDVPGYFGPCPIGYYCLGSSAKTACPAGTFNPSTTGSDSDHCLPCPAGYACTTTGLSTYTGTLCRQGWYCEESSTTREPGGGICPIGSYCPQGSAISLLCAAGTYQELTNQSSCKTCPPGYYCPPGTGDYTSYVCPSGYYCPSGTSYSKQYPCSIGKYNPNQGQQSDAACIDCTPGYYCNKLGASAVAGQCDAGFYCTSGSTTARPIESQTYGGRCNPGYYCPQGSTSNIPCDSGKYCSDDELSAVSGSCKAGYYCNSKATTPAPTDGTTGNICSPMYYCTGSASPVQCSAGYYLPYSGASASTECITCSPGYYCNGSTDSNMRQACTAGFYCSGGDITPTNECERGYMCPAGTAEEILCPAGEYQMNTKQSSCITCDDGYYCELGATAETLCPIGYYCPEGTGYRYSYPCPVGTYNSLIGQSSSGACATCDAGKYCPTLGASLYQDVCADGYYCTAGAVTSMPSGSDSTGGICSPGYYCPAGSSAPTACEAGLYCGGYALAAQSGSCLAGYYCKTGSKVANPTDTTHGNICSPGNYCPTESSDETTCSAGTYSPSYGLSDYTQCLDCPYGKYCDSPGLSSPTDDCDEGYYCEPGKASPTPPEGECPTGYYCEAGSWVPVPCAMGYYNTQTQQSSCTKCGSGYYCTGGTAIQTNCPNGYHCPAGTRYSNEFPCGPGTYADVTNLDTCKDCPAGRECNNAATNANNLCPQYKYCPEKTGYGLICPAGSYNKDSEGLEADTDCSVCPSGQYCVDGRISGQCAPGFWCKKSSPYSTPAVYTLEGTPCPSGYYCGMGTTTPTKCPEGKFRKDTGATQVSDCTTCPPGSYCVTGNPTPFDCPKGNYCPSGVNSPTPCPKYTYNGSKSMSDINACKPCPAGYYCDDTGVGDYTQYPCKKGYFCVLGAESYIPCPPGTVGSSTIAGSAESCPPCPGGYYCEEATINPVPCTIGTYCPLGSSAPIPCTPGYICDDLTETPTKCPVHYYCPLYDSNNLTKYYTEDEAILCPNGTICQLANFYPETCAPGTYMADNVCIECGAGLYTNGTSSEKCYPCDAGYLCVAGATRSNPQTLSTDGGYPCPSGYYCPEGTESAIPCPVTTYNPSTKGTSASSCLSCPTNTYGDETGLSKCKICGSHAYSDVGQDTCQCSGKYRTYQKYDGSCICLPTYEFVIEGVTESDVDSAEDCTPVQYTNCISGQVRKADGSCKSSGSCESECNGSSGSLDSTYSVCICDDTPSEEDVCNSTCRSTSASVSLKSDGQFYIYNPTTGSSRPVSMTGSNYLGATSVSNSSKVHTIDMTTDGPQGVYGTGSSLSTYYRRLLADEESSRDLASSSSGLSNPIACISRNDTFLFSLTPRSHYPVYLKDSLLNTNKNFDYAAFKELEWRMKSSSSYVDTFAFTFTDAGIYDFVDNADSDKHVIIAVVGDSESCPSADVTFLARTAVNLDSLNIYAADNLMTEPQWGIIAGIIVALIILIILIIGFLSFLHWRAWASVNSKERLYAMLRSCCKKCRFKSNLVPVVPAFEESIEDGIDFDKELLEPSQFKDMYDNLCKYYDRVKAAFDAQDEEATVGLNELLEQARELKDQLADKLADVDPEILKQKIVEAEYDEDEEVVLPEATIDEEIIPSTYNDAVAEILRKETLIEGKNTEILSKDIQSNPDLLEHDKQELIGELNANMQRLDQLLNADIQNSQSELNKRLQERAAKRRAAQREKAYYEPKKAEIIARQKEENKALENEYQDKVENINQEYLDEKENYKKETRREVEQRLLEIRTQLQNDLANSKNQQETDALMKNFEIEAKRIEDQLTAHKKQQEADLFKRLEERRKGRLGKVNASHEEKKKDMDERHQEELAQLERNTLLAFAEGGGEIYLNEEEQREIEEVGESYDQEIVRLQEAHQQELLQIDNMLDQEEAAQSEEKERLIKALENASSQTEKDQILKEIDRLDEALGVQKGKQEGDLKQRLLDRKRRKAEKEAQIKIKQDRERFDIEMLQKEAERDARSNIEMRKMEDILENAGNMSPEELIGLARQLLEAKHDREVNELTALKHGKLRERQNTLIQAAVNIKAVERANLRAQYLAQREALKKRKLKPDELQAKLEELETREKEAQNQLEFNNMAQLNAEQDQAWRDVEEEFRQKFNDLADTHMKENAEIFKKISESDPRMANANLSDMEKDIDKLRSENERLYAEKLRDLDLRNQQLREFERRKELEINSIQEQLKEVEEKQRRLEEIQEQRRIMEERQRMMVEVMKERGISPEKMEELLKQHQKEMDEWEKSMEDERNRQKNRLQAKLDERKQKYQEKISSQIQKYKEENLKLIEQQDKEEQERLKIISYSGVEVKLWEPKEDIESNLRIGGEVGKDGEKSDMSLLDQILQRVRRVEKIAENVDTSQFDQLMKAMKHVNDMVDKVRKKIR